MLYLTPALTVYCYCLTALLGLVMGSFLNCLAWRLANGESVSRGRSHCARCGHPLAPRDLVPLVSWLSLRGRCRYCGEPISPRYPAVELTAALVYVSLLARYGLSWTALGYGALASVLLALSLVDLDTQLLPDSLVLAAGLCSLLLLPDAAGPWYLALARSVGSALAVSLPLLALVLAADKLLGRETMGGGDLKLLFAIGLSFPWQQNLLLLILACLLGLVLGFVLVRARPGVPFPFAPALAGAAWLTMLFGRPVLAWYLSLFY